MTGKRTGGKSAGAAAAANGADAGSSGAAVDGAATTKQTVAADYYLRPFTAEVRNDTGLFGAVQPYTMEGLGKVVAAVEAGLRTYGAYAMKVDVQTDVTCMMTAKALVEYTPRSDRVLEGSKVGFTFADGSLECRLYVGKAEVRAVEERKMDEEDAFLKRAGKLGWGAAEDVVVIGLSTLAGGFVGGLAKHAIVRGAGLIVAKSGQLYGAARFGRRLYDEMIPTGFCTLELKPTSSMGVTREQQRVYTAFVHRYK